MSLLLATVELALPVWIFGTLSRTFRAIDDELKTRALTQYLRQCGRFSGRQVVFAPKREGEDGREPMNPFTDLGLAHAEKERLDTLKWGRCESRTG